MKKITAGLLLFPALGFTVEGFQLGVKYDHRNMGYEYGTERLFEKDFNQVGLFANYSFYNNFAAELQLFTSFKKKVERTLGANEQAFEISDYTSGEPNKYRTQASINGGGLSLYAYYPLASQVQAFVNVGANITKVKLASEILLKNNANPTDTEKTQHKISESKTSFVPRLGAGLDFAINNMFGVKAQLSFENTSQLKKTFNIDGIAGKDLVFKAKNSFLFGLSAYVKV